MKTVTASSLLLSAFVFLLASTLSYAQRNVNPYKKNKEKTIIIDESNVYNATKDEDRKTLALKDTVVKGDFSKFVATIKTVENSYLINEKSNLNSFSRVFMDTYTKYFNIKNGLNETIILEPKGRNSLYLIGKLDNMPYGITALLFYAFEGSSIQFTKLVTFNDAGIPIAEKNIQYYIKGSDDGFAQEGKTTCQLNSDQTVSCINYVEQEGETEMTPKSEKIYQIQEDGSIKEIGMIDLEKQLTNNEEK